MNEQPEKEGLKDYLVAATGVVGIFVLPVVLCNWEMFLFAAPLWLPVGFAVNLAIERQFTFRGLFLFTTLEAASIALSRWLWENSIRF